MAKSVRWGWPAVFVLGTACSAQPHGGGVGADQAWADLSSSLCNKIGACTPFVLVADYGDAQTCASRQRLALPKELSGPGSGTTPSNIEACAQAFAAATCADFIAGTPPEACIIHGSLPQGAACGDSSQCAGANSYCNLGDSGTCGVCGTRAAAGATCSADSDCRSGMVCATTAGATGVCVVPAAAGATCDSTPCIRPLVCVSAAADGGMGSCAQPAAVDASCDPNAQNCNGLEDLLCDLTTNVCTALPTATLGGPCGLLEGPLGTYTMCVGGTYCALPAGRFAGTCVARSVEGAPCDPTDTIGRLCLAPAVCANGVCTIRDPSTCQ